MRERRPPSGGLDEVNRPERRDQYADRRDEPEQHDEENGDPREPPCLVHAEDPALRRAALARRRGDEVGWRDGRGDRHRIDSCCLNCRTFHTMTGMTARKRTTAMAAP